MDYDIQWQDRYKEMVSTAKKALKNVRSGQRVFIGTGCGEPTKLVKALTTRASELSRVEILQLCSKNNAAYKKNTDSFTPNSFFINPRNTEGLASSTPTLLSHIPHLFHSGRIPLDIVLIQVTPPDINGKVSLGISVDIVRSAVENGSLIIAQVNPQMPWTLGDSLVDVYDLDILVPADVPLMEKGDDKINETSRTIGRTVATLIHDGSTLQLGFGQTADIGRIPHAVIPSLRGKKNLGIHCEIITDSIIELVESGVVDGSTKSANRGKIVTSLCMGTRKLYDYVHNNPLFSFRPTDSVNDLNIVSEQSKMVTISPGRQIDLTGQVYTDSVDGQCYSGGLIDFNRNGARFKDTKNIITLPAIDNKHSRIVSRLSHGTGVTITRDAIHYVVTEYGVACLYGKSIQDRVMALISIAHPDFRKQLFTEAVDAQYIRPVVLDTKTGLMVPGDDSLRDTILLKDNNQVNFRSMQPNDEPNMRDLIHDLSKETINYRFMGQKSRSSHIQIQDFVYIDHRKDVIVVGTIPDNDGNDTEIICMGRYFLNEETNRAEVAIIIGNNWQNRGLGTFLFDHLAAIAERNGITGFTAEVLRNNQKIHTIINHSGFKIFHTLVENIYNFRIDF